MFKSPLSLLSTSSFTLPEIDPKTLPIGTPLDDGIKFTLGREFGTVLLTGTPLAAGDDDDNVVGTRDGTPEPLRSTKALPVEESPGDDNTTKILLSLALSESETSKNPTRFVSLMTKIPTGTLLNTNEPVLSVKVVAKTTRLVELTRDINTLGIATSPILSLLISSVTLPDTIPNDDEVGNEVAPGLIVTLGKVDDDTGLAFVGAEVEPGTNVTLGKEDDDTGFTLVGSDVTPGTSVKLGKVDKDTGFKLVGTTLKAGDAETVGDTPGTGT